MPAPRHPFRFGLQASSAGSRAEWVDLARRAEDLGYASLAIAEHLVDAVVARA